jgi:UDP-4-amino-4,6-dideoxy-N-acetyl-beta-L-altrosamine N-acetyltransferase
VQNPFLIGKTIYLRPLERADAPTVQPWINDPDVRRHLLAHRPMNLHGEEDFIDKLQKSEDSVGLVIVVRETDRSIGVCGLHNIELKSRQAALGILLGAKDEWDHGHGTEATRLIVEYGFDTLNLNRIWLHVFEDNARARRCYEKVGFQREGILRQEHYRAGRYWDTITMAILRDEWQALAERA